MTKPNAMITIPHRWKPEPVCVSETATTIREACEEAVSKGVSLAHTHLTDADLSDADLTDADLSGADLFGADLPGVSLSGAVLTDADLTDADLTDADLTDADLSGADLSGAVLARARGLPDAPRVEDLDRKILDAIEAPGHGLGMGSWHTCQTTHCIAGWAVHLAGEAGYELEGRVGPCAAGALIYHASTGYVPDFYEDSEKALADLRARAEKGSPGDLGSPTTGARSPGEEERPS